MTFPTAGRRLRYGAVLLIAAFGVGVAVAMSLMIATWEAREAERDFENRARDRLRTITSDFSEATSLLYSLRALLESSEHPVTAREFDRFAVSLHRGAVGLRDAGWAPHVAAADRESFERGVRETLMPEYRITEREGAALVPAKQRPEYYPVLFSEGPEEARRVIGLDLAFEARRRGVIARAIETGRLVSTPPIDLVVSKGLHGGLISYLAVGVGERGGDASAARGVVFGVFDISLMFDNIVSAKANLTDLDLYFFQPGAAPGDAANYVRLSSPVAKSGATRQSLLAGVHWSGTMPIMEQTWTAIFTPPLDVGRPWRWHAMLPLGIGLAMTAMVTLFLTLSLRRNDQLHALAASLHRTTQDLHDRAEEVSFLARHDALTGLPNRMLFKERLADALTALGRGHRFALLCVDLDRFKAVNDTRGHAVGDQLLVQVAERMRACARAGDTVARVGGDEFVAILRDIASRDDAAQAARRIIEAVSAGYVIEAEQVSVGASIGIAVAPDDGQVADVLMIRADLALYASKSGGRGMFRFFGSDLDLKLAAGAGSG